MLERSKCKVYAHTGRPAPTLRGLYSASIVRGRLGPASICHAASHDRRGSGGERRPRSQIALIVFARDEQMSY